MTRYAALAAAARASAGRFVIVEDHYPEGGLGCAVTDALLEAGHTHLAVAHLAVRGMPGSGTAEELLAWAGIDADHISRAAEHVVNPAGARL